MLNPCPKCQSFGKCSGSCWLRDLAAQSEAIDNDMQTPEYQAIVEGCIPKINLMSMGRTDQEMYWAEKEIAEMF